MTAPSNPMEAPTMKAFERALDEAMRYSTIYGNSAAAPQTARAAVVEAYREALEDARREADAAEARREYGGVLVESLFEEGVDALKHGNRVVGFNENGDLLCGWPKDADEHTRADIVFNDEDFAAVFAWLADAATAPHTGGSNG